MKKLRLTFTTILMGISSVAFFTYANSSMKLDMALAVLSTRVEGTRIDAFLVVASLVVGAVRVICAFWFGH